jgi:hypothetical protein
MTKIAKLKSLVQQYLTKYGKLFICVSGISGAGKTYHARLLAKFLGLTHIDQDIFFTKDLPIMTLSDGTRVYNWDCEESLELHQMSSQVHDALPQGLIFSGFACRDDWFQDSIDLQMHLFIDQPTCQIRRQEQHKDPPNLAEQIVREQVWPFYQQTLLESSYEIAFNSMRKTPNTLIEIINYLIDWMETHLGIDQEARLQKAEKIAETFQVHYEPEAQVELVEQLISPQTVKAPTFHNDDPIVSHMGGKIYHQGQELGPGFYHTVGGFMNGLGGDY